MSNLLESLLVFKLNVTLNGKDIDVKVTVKDFTPIRIEPMVKSNESLLDFMNMSQHQKAEINNRITNHLNSVRENLSNVYV